MSLNSAKLAPCLRSGKVLVAEDGHGIEPFSKMLRTMIREHSFPIFLFKCAEMYPDLLDSNDIVEYITSHLDCELEDLVAYCIYTEASQVNFRLVERHFNIPDDRFFVFASLTDRAIIVANKRITDIIDPTKQVTSKKPAGDMSKASYSLQQIIRTRTGYHTACEDYTVIRPFSEILNTETIELHNKDIYAYLSAHYSQIAALDIPYNSEDEINIALCSYFNTQIIKILSSIHNKDFSCLPCCWSCADVDAVKQYYINPFEDVCEDIIKLTFEGELYPLADLSASGCLFAADNIHITTLEVAENKVVNDVTNTKTSVFSGKLDRGQQHTVLGVPSYERVGFAFAITADSYKTLYDTPPSSERASTRYKGLFLTRIVPNVSAWDKVDNTHLLKVTFDDYGIIAIAPTDIPVDKISEA